MSFDWEFAKNLSLVVVPTMIGIIGSNILVFSWQIKKEKFALRKEILSSFHDSFAKSNTILYNLFIRITQEYSTIPKNSKMTKTSSVGIWNYPTKEEEKPYSIFSEEYKKLVSKSSELYHKSRQFDVLLNLYYVKPEKMQEIIDALFDSLELTTNELKRMVYTQNLREIINSSKDLIDHHNKNFELLGKLEMLILKEKLKNPRESIIDFSFLKR